jgi:hypothetical protein
VVETLKSWRVLQAGIRDQPFYGRDRKVRDEPTHGRFSHSQVFQTL